MNLIAPFQKQQFVGRAHEVGLFGPVAHKNAYVNKVNRGKRL